MNQEARALLDRPINWREFTDTLDLYYSRILTSCIVQEYHKFLVLKVMQDDAKLETLRLAPPPLIEQIWHRHMLMPQHYLQVCRILLGNDNVFEYSPAVNELHNRATRYATTLSLYESTFGPADAQIWPKKEVPEKSSTIFITFFWVFNLEPKESMSVVLERCGKQLHLSPAQLRLFWDGMRIQENKTLSQNGIPNMTHLDLAKEQWG